MSIPANAGQTIVFADHNLTPPTGYTYLSVMGIITGANSVDYALSHVQGLSGYTDDAHVGFCVKNSSSSSVSWPVRVIVTYMKT